MLLFVGFRCHPPGSRHSSSRAWAAGCSPPPAAKRVGDIAHSRAPLSGCTMTLCLRRPICAHQNVTSSRAGILIDVRYKSFMISMTIRYCAGAVDTAAAFEADGARASRAHRRRLCGSWGRAIPPAAAAANAAPRRAAAFSCCRILLTFKMSMSWLAR